MNTEMLDVKQVGEDEAEYIDADQVSALISITVKELYGMVDREQIFPPENLAGSDYWNRKKLYEWIDNLPTRDPYMEREAELYRHFDADGNLLYIGVSLCTLYRLSQHKTNSKWFKQISKITIERYETRELAEKAEKKAIKDEHPIYNIQHNG